MCMCRYMYRAPPFPSTQNPSIQHPPTPTPTPTGKTYDHVFPIEIEQPGGMGVQNLQIGYNNGDNPFQAAQTFIVSRRRCVEIGRWARR